MISKVARKACETTTFENSMFNKEKEFKDLTDFINSTVKESGLGVLELMTALIYLQRVDKGILATSKTLKDPKASQWIFLGAIIIAHKYQRDPEFYRPIHRPFYNIEWSRLLSGEYKSKKVTIIEKEVLTILDYNTHIPQDVYYTSLSDFLDYPHALL